MDKKIIKQVTRGTLYAVITTLALVLLFAGVLIVAPISDGAIKPVVQVIKVLSIFVGVIVALKHVNNRGWMYGGIVGLIYTVLAFFVFSIIYNEFGVTSGLLTDMLFAVVIGAISAMVLKTLRSQAV